ncbi:hypothetical protein Mp_7g10510 [Marchantia polymorpha subsp. ruderalis]|uniref:Uncharacterized protein n=2 Tax=Marchantia polymorpha TaxID=3197 RepID=A0AAF6BY45_MARPO|nr:hypothetical protein MARPO_0003s0070 [Marchantia polymorpha]BBN16929.1 hypothetical protein Mp_7g10510 [Marchantia polymorpha subsp. ruderalis]|eukprot:PTQ49170.1 hypothetical protein MARPO_0003s0070 [Marchantia polymorpha]
MIRLDEGIKRSQADRGTATVDPHRMEEREPVTEESPDPGKDPRTWCAAIGRRSVTEYRDDFAPELIQARAQLRPQFACHAAVTVRQPVAPSCLLPPPSPVSDCPPPVQPSPALSSCWPGSVCSVPRGLNFTGLLCCSLSASCLRLPRTAAPSLLRLLVGPKIDPSLISFGLSLSLYRGSVLVLRPSVLHSFLLSPALRPALPCPRSLTH